MGQLNDLKMRIEQKIKTDGLDEALYMGKIGLSAGKLMAFVKPSTPDDPETIAKLKLAAKKFLNLAL